MREQVLDTIAEPDMIQVGGGGELLAVRFYPVTPFTSKFVVAAYRELDDEDGFVATAYLASRLSRRRSVLWTR